MWTVGKTNLAVDFRAPSAHSCTTPYPNGASDPVNEHHFAHICTVHCVSAVNIHNAFQRVVKHGYAESTEGIVFEVAGTYAVRHKTNFMVSPHHNQFMNDSTTFRSVNGTR
jgi:hypothetical protein